MKINTGTLITLATTGILAVALLSGCADKGTATEADSDNTSMETEGVNNDDRTDGSTTNEPAVEAKLVEFRNDDGELVCPVMGDLIVSAEEAFGFQDYEGIRYYFCCGMCPDSFEADPDKYVVDGDLEPGHEH